MRCMSRNKVRFFYALFEGKERILNESGRFAGEYGAKHGKPMEYFANISAAKGETQTRQFGENESYDKVIVMDIDAPPIDEYSVLWIDTVPQLDDEGNLAVDEKGKILTPHDYLVKKVARSMNVVSLAVSKVSVSG